MPNDNSNSTESKKTKVTITLDENLVNQIDSEVKKRNYSSRSNAIEVLLKSFIPKADTALFLLSGVDRVFKKDRELPLILEELRNLVKQGVRNITISYNESDVEFYKELRKEVNKIEMENKGVKITTDYTHSTNGDASTLIYFNYESSRFNALLVIHGTVLRGTDGNKVDYRKLYEYHLSHEADLTMVLGDLNLHDPDLIEQEINEKDAKLDHLKSQTRVLLEGTEVKAIYKFQEKKNQKNLTSVEKRAIDSSLVDLGLYVINPSLIKYIRNQIKKHPESFASFTVRHPDHLDIKSVIENLIENGRNVSGYVFAGRWFHFRRLKE